MIVRVYGNSGAIEPNGAVGSTLEDWKKIQMIKADAIGSCGQWYPLLHLVRERDRERWGSGPKRG